VKRVAPPGRFLVALPAEFEFGVQTNVGLNTKSKFYTVSGW
jgi:hypothetical protein